MKKILISLMLCIISVMSFGQLNFEEKTTANLEKICNDAWAGAIYMNLDDSTFVYIIYGNYYIYDFGKDETAPSYIFKLIFNTKQELIDFLISMKDIYDNNREYQNQKITFRNNGEIYEIHVPSSKMSAPWITLSNIVWLNGRQYRNDAGYVGGYIYSVMSMKKINKSLSKY